MGSSLDSFLMEINDFPFLKPKHLIKWCSPHVEFWTMWTQIHLSYVGLKSILEVDRESSFVCRVYDLREGEKGWFCSLVCLYKSWTGERECWRTMTWGQKRNGDMLCFGDARTGPLVTSCRDVGSGVAKPHLSHSRENSLNLPCA